MKLVKDYMNDMDLRHKLNILTQETFGFDFEDWVTNGYYEGDYIPYSYEENGIFIANVSVNRMDFIQNGEQKHYIQLGTVMTKKEYQNQGYAKKLMKQVLADYAGKCDGIYLFGNLDAVGFYEKMGFSIGMQYRYTLKEEEKIRIREKAERKNSAEYFYPVNGQDLLQKEMYKEVVRNSAVNAALEQKNKYGLQMFYTAGMEQVYYSSKQDCYIVMEKQEGTLYLQSVISKEKISLEDVLTFISEDFDTLILGFAPCKEDVSMFEAKMYDGEEDYRMFYYGENLKSIETEKLYFPEFSHA